MERIIHSSIKESSLVYRRQSLSTLQSDNGGDQYWIHFYIIFSTVIMCFNIFYTVRYMSVILLCYMDAFF